MTQQPRPGGDDPVGAVPEDGAWAVWVADLVRAVRSLPDDGSLTVTAPETAARPVRLRKARLGGFIPARHRITAPWVRLTRAEEHLRGACVGSEAVGGHFPLSPEERAALADLGWREPPQLEGEDYLRWWPDDVPTGPFLPEDDARRAALAVAATFRTVLAPTPEDDRSPTLPTVTTD